MINKIYKISSGIVVTLLIFLGLLLIATALPLPGNMKSYVVQSGSMQPAIKTGSLVFIKSNPFYSVGDIITFGSANSVPTTHRIVEIKESDGAKIYITKGDANGGADQRPITASEIRGKVFLNLPYVGYVVHFAKTPVGFEILVVLPASFLIFEELKKIWIEILKIRQKRKELLSKNKINE